MGKCIMGEQSGNLELVLTPVPRAVGFTQELLTVPLSSWLPVFEENYLTAQLKAQQGHTKRAEMPVLEEDDLEDFKTALQALSHVDCVEDVIAAKDLIPTQRQIYFDKSITPTVKFGKDATFDHLRSQHLYVSKDRGILDGHHRWLSAMLLDPEFTFLVLVVEEDAQQALRDSLIYSDSRNHERNQ